MDKKKFKFSKTDIIIVLICLTGALFCGAAFWGAYNNTLEKLNEEPVGEIIFQKRVAHRKFIERNVWDRLRQSSAIYNGDTIRTIEQAEAIIILGDEVTNISMGEYTIIQVFFSYQKGAQIDFSEGNLDVSSENSSVMITSGDSIIVVEGQSRMEKSDEGFVLSVLEGQVSFDGNEMEAGSILALEPDGSINKNPIITMTSFRSSAYVLGNAQGKTPVEFSWNNFNFDKDTFVIIEIAADRGFNNKLETRDVYVGEEQSSSVFISLETGNYWWRAYPAARGTESLDNRKPVNRFFPSGTLEVIPAAQTVLISPLNRAELILPIEPRVQLSWSASEGAFSYQLEISAHSDLNSPSVSRRIESNSLTIENINYGKWYWRITPVFPAHIKGNVIPSIINEFSIERFPRLSPIFFSANIDNWNNIDAETTAANNRTIFQVVELLNSDSNLKVQIDGHANPVTNPALTAARLQEQIEFLQPMSEARAKKIMELLVERGIDQSRIEYRGLGGDQPVIIWQDTRNWRLNRRVEINFISN